MKVLKAAKGEPPAALGERTCNLIVEVGNGELWAFV